MEENELDQSEAIKKWWKENGTAVFTGVLLGLALLFGWRGWKSYEASQQEMASMLYSQSVASFEQGNATKAREIASQLLSEYNTSAYATQITLRLARQAVEDNNYDSAHAHLDWVIKQNQTSEFTSIAQLRKARLFVAEQKLDDLKALLKTVEGNEGAFKIAYAEIRGDLAVLEGRIEDARKAYQEVLAVEENAEDGLSFEHRDLVEMKLNDLGQAEQIVAPPPPAPKIEDIEDTAESPVTETAEPAAEAPATETVEPVAEVPATETVEPVAEVPVTETAESVVEVPATETVEPAAEVPATETVEPVAEVPVTETVEPAAEAPALETSIKNLSEALGQSVDPQTGEISVEALEKLAPTLSDIAEKLTSTPASETPAQP